MKKKLPLSVALISYNEENNIVRTLESITDIASEIIVVDSGSTDRTRQVAELYGAKVYLEEWKGFVEQKNSALKKCSEEWIIFLDCDEVPDEILIQNIKKVVLNSQKNGYILDRRTYYLGKLMNFAWHPDYKLRLVKRSANPQWTGLNLHERLIVEGEVAKLKGKLIHYSFLNLSHHFSKTVKYAKSSAESYYQAGKRFRMTNLLFNPFFAFIKLYFINLGFLDGVRGLIAGISSYFGTFLKYSYLWELERKIQ
jgi:glycosyltransferase involved in cell wall biosynthesis